MVKLTEIKYGRTYNMGNYETERIDLTAVLSETEDPIVALASLKEFCNAARTPIVKNIK